MVDNSHVSHEDMYEDNGIPWTVKDEIIFQEIRLLIEAQDK